MCQDIMMYLCFAAIPANMIGVSIPHKARSFIDKLSYSFNVKSWDENCNVSKIEKQKFDTYKRSFCVKKVLFAYQGIKIRWSK